VWLRFEVHIKFRFCLKGLHRTRNLNGTDEFPTAETKQPERLSGSFPEDITNHMQIEELPHDEIEIGSSSAFNLKEPAIQWD
jgi:hypothetical protein